MPHSRVTKANPKHTVTYHLIFPGWLKNDLIKLAKKHKLSLNKYIGLVLANHVRENNNLILPPLVSTTPRDPLQPISDYLQGVQTLQPCGRVKCDKVLIELSGDTYCSTCGIQVH